MIDPNIKFQRSAAAVQQNVFILNFHGLGEPLGSQSRSDEDYWTDPHLFAAILQLVQNRPDVLITFDDSYESDYTVALPLLEASKMTARFFVVANRVGQTGFLSDQQIQSLCAAGMTVGSHGMYHRKWPGLSDRELQEEIVEARERIEQITGARVVEAACPFGGYDRRVLGQSPRLWIRTRLYQRWRSCLCGVLDSAQEHHCSQRRSTESLRDPD